MSMKRIEGIELSKAIMILLVVYGHLLERQMLDGDSGGFIEVLYRWIYLFHMPFFFILSGFLYSTARPIGSYFFKKWNHLMLPYFAWLLLFNLKSIAGFGYNLVVVGMEPEKWTFYLNHFSDELYGGTRVHGAEVIFWFPPCLFFTQQLFNFIKNRISSEGWSALLMLAVYLVGYAGQFRYPEFTLPLALNVVAGALPLFYLGHLLRNEAIHQKALKYGLIPVMLVLYLAHALPDWTTVHMRMGVYGVPVLSTLAAMGAFTVILALCARLERNWVLPFCLPVAGASMTIMYLHLSVINMASAQGVEDLLLLFLVGTFGSIGIHFLFARTSMASVLFLGLKRK